MQTIKLGGIAIEAKESNKGDKTGCKIVGLEHLTPSDVTLSAWSDDTNNSFTKKFAKGDVLFGRRRAYLKKAALAPFDGICSGDITVIRAKEGKVDPRLLPFIIQNDFLFEFAVGKSAGSLSPRVKWEHLRNFEISLPDTDKQRELADILWSINETKQAYFELIKQTDELVKSQFIEMFGDPITNDYGWPTEPIKKVAPEHKPDIPSEEKYWWLNLDMIETYSGVVIEKVYAELESIGNSTSTFDATMVLYSKLRPYLNKVVVPEGYGYCTNELVGLKPDENVLNKHFLFNLLRSDNFVSFANSLSSGAQMPRMPVKALREFQCILPPIDLQEKFVMIAHQSDKSKFELQDAIDNLDALSKKIIAENLIAAGKE